MNANDHADHRHARAQRDGEARAGGRGQEEEMKPIALRVVSSGMALPLVAAYYYRWPLWTIVLLLIADAYLNFVDGYESAKAMMRSVWKLPK